MTIDTKGTVILSEEDFYPAEDKRYVQSFVCSSRNFSFYEYLKDFYTICDEEELFED